MHKITIGWLSIHKRYLAMLNLPYADIDIINFKHSRSLNCNLKLLARNKETSHLISIQNLEKGSFLAEENKPVHGIYFILEGKVKIFNTELDQKTKVFRLASKGDVVGFSRFYFSNYWSSAIALEKTKAFYINNKSLKYILKNNNKLSLLLVNALVLKLQHFEIRQRYVNLFPAAERVIEALLLIGSKFGDITEKGLEFSNCTTRREIATFANVSTENAIRILSALISKNYISAEGKKIIIINKQELINQLKKYCCSHKLPNALNSSFLDILND
ncbi:MAG: Crp/Fnr family transcriptional regulator [Lutibacter sp.]